MSTTVCSNQNCKYRKAVFCELDHVVFNQWGMCKVWFDRNGRARPFPDYQPEPSTVREQEPPAQKNQEDSEEDIKKGENVGINEKEE